VDTGNKEGQYHDPRGLTVNNKYAYICDCENHRIQVILKENGTFINQWGDSYSTDFGKFVFPYSIFLDLLDEIFIIGDSSCVQFFTSNGLCLQRLGEALLPGNKLNQFDSIYGICTLDGCLFVSEYTNQRIQIFKSKVT